MCTLALFFCTFENFPLLLAANRDERYDRPSAAPALVPGQPKIVAGTDLQAGGTWLGVNDRGIVAAILNRRSNGEARAKLGARSRGQICLDLLKCESMTDAKRFLESHRISYNPFTAVVADRHDALAAYNTAGEILVQRLETGLHVFSSAAEIDLRSDKAERALSLFSQAGKSARLNSSSGTDAIAVLQPVLGDHSAAVASDDPGDAICVHRADSGTVSSSVVRFCEAESRFEMFYCAGAPCSNTFGADLALGVS